MFSLLLTSSQSLRNHLTEALGCFVEVVASLDHLPGKYALQAGDILWVDADEQDRASLQALCRGELGRVKVIILSMKPADAEAVAWLGHGAVAYLHGYAQAETLRQALTVVQSGGIWVGSSLMQQLCERFGALSQPAADQAVELTQREKEVIAQLRLGASNKLIARELDISERTVKAHLTAIFGKFGVHDRVQLLLKLAAA